MIRSNQLVLISSDRKCNDCKNVTWEWIKDQDQMENSRCSCGSLFKQRPIQNYKEDWTSDIDITPYI